MHKRSSLAGLAAFTLLTMGCASAPTQPVLYPNAAYNMAGARQVQLDIADCKQRAHAFGLSPTHGNQAGKSAAGGALVGAASAAAWTLVKGGNVGENAAAGAATGGAAGGVRGALRGDRPNKTYQTFVKKCLNEFGYEVIGWK